MHFTVFAAYHLILETSLFEDQRVFLNDKNIPKEKAENIIEKTVDVLKETNYENDKWYADYKRLRVKAIKK